MIKNKDLLNKKQFLKGMVSLPNIVLEPEEADRFIDYVVDESFWKDNARIVKMNKQEKNIRYLDFTSGARFLKPAATFASSDYTKEFAEGKIKLSTEKLRGAVVIYDDDLEDGIEGQAFADHLMKIVAKKVANELDEIFYVSNSSFAATDARSVFEGFRYLLFQDKTGSSGTLPGDATRLNAASTGSGYTETGKIAEQSTSAPYNWEFKFSRMISQLPSKYKTGGLSSLRFFCNDIIASDYTDALAERSTILGDNAILGKGPLQYGQVQLANVPQMPTTYAGSSGELGTEATTGGSYADVILTTKDNFIIGLQRELKMESERSAADEATYVFYSIRCDLAIGNPEAAVLAYNITHS